MKRKKIAIVFAAMSLMLMTGCGAQKEKLKADTLVEKEFSEVSVHDPSIIEGEDGSYYIFGSHLAVAKTEDLMNWTYVNQGVKNNNTVIPNVLKEMKEAFEWSQSNTFWAPDVIKLNDGSYKLYYCNCKGDSPLSCLGTAVSDSVEGPYSNEGIMLKSGMSASEKDEDGNLYQATTDPNVVDPVVFYDKEGKLWMIYGSYSGGIFVKEMDAESGMPLESGYGEKLLGGNHLRIEAPYVIYNEETGYYYMFLSFGGLDSDGGYNIRVCRSENPNGPYVDAVDTVTAKLELVMKAKEKNIPIISSMGAGNKLDASAFKVADIYKTKVCPLAKVMRRELKKRGIKKLKVVYSEEQPIRPIEDMSISCRTNCICPPGAKHKCTERRNIPGSTAFVPSVAGLIIAGEVIKDLCKKNECFL